MLKAFMYPDIPEAGCDEAGRGCLCGPVSCAAVILPPGFSDPGLNDSKQLSPARREELRVIIEREALAWAVVMVEAGEIDRINILNASITGMHRALDALTVRPAHIIVDGNRFKPYRDPITGIEIAADTVVKGDGKYLAIAAASILAKTHRDRLMIQYAAQYPGYDWDKNMGYPTAAHKKGIQIYGLTPLHRKSFKGCNQVE